MGPACLVTGGAGYIGSLLTGVLLQRGYRVVVVDDLLFGGNSLLGYWYHPNFRFVKGNVCETATLTEIGSGTNTFDAVVHLAAIVGFPACNEAGYAVTWRYNVEATKRVFDFAEATGAKRLIFASSYSNYGVAKDGKPVTEESPLFPQSSYAETKIAAEQYLREQAKQAQCAPLMFRFATLFGLSPRTRFDLIVNQFVMQAITTKELVIYQRDFSRSFVHVRDAVESIAIGLEHPEEKIRGQVYNVGSEFNNFRKDEIAALIQKHVPDTIVTYGETSVAGDMRDITASFAKIREGLGFVPSISVEQGIIEVRDALQAGIVTGPFDGRYRNARTAVQ